MRLSSCRLESVRRHRQLELAFSPGLTLISGPNESGKSTLVDAMHRGLFLRASATGAPVQTLRSRQHPGHPLVEIGFEAQGRAWTLQKRFSGSSGTVRLAGTGRPALLGSEAEETLASLLGVDDILGSRQANRGLPSRWAHLWVMQGEAGQDLLARGAEHYDLDALIEQLESRAEGALQSPLDQRIHDQLEGLVQASITSRGIRQNSALWQYQQDSAAARQALEEASRERQAFELSGAELDRIVAELEAIQREQLPSLQRSRQRQQQRRTLQQALEPLRLKRERLERSRNALLKIDDEEHRQANQRQQLEAELRQLEGSLEQLQQALLRSQEQQNTLESQRQVLELRGQTLRRLEEQASLGERLKELEGRQRASEALQQQRQTLLIQLKGCSSLTEQELMALQRDGKALEALAIREQAMATRVRVLKAHTTVSVDGTPLESGEERLLSQAFRLRIGDDVDLQVTPGGETGLEAMVRERATLESKLQQGLKRLGLTSLSEAEAQWRRRHSLEEERKLIDQQLRLQQEGDQQAPEAAISAVRERLEALESEAEEGDGREANTATASELKAELERCRITYRQVQESAKRDKLQTQHLEQQLRLAEQQVQQKRLGRERLDAEQGARRQQRQVLVEESGDLQALDPALEALRRDEQALRQQLHPLEQEGNAEIIDPEARESELRERLQELSGQRGALQERCDALRLQDPYAAEEGARSRLEQVEARERGERLLVDARSHLLSLFQQARSDLSSRYTLPLRRSIDAFLAPLLIGDGGTDLGYDPKRGLGALSLERDGLSLPFADLSGGMKEQLNGALRLAIADVLREGHDGSLPVLFDDAFTNSDPGRLRAVRSMLRQAVDRGLQVIVMSCDADPYREIADSVVELTGGE